MQDELNELLESLKELDDQTGMVDILIAETLKYRDMLMEDTGETLTVGDTKAALDALEDHLGGGGNTDELSNTQQILFERWKKAISQL